ncbi:MAG: hypothetical protein AB1Z23_06985 [Eubacteriales bacterium]
MSSKNTKHSQKMGDSKACSRKRQIRNYFGSSPKANHSRHFAVIFPCIKFACFCGFSLKF